MIDLRADSIIYQSQGYLVELIDGLIKNKRLGKVLDKDWDKAEIIIYFLEAWTEKDKLEDNNQANYLLECLIELAKLNEFPAAPSLTVTTPPAIIVGGKGDKGDKGDTGSTGPTGLATDIQTIISITSTIDTFDVEDAKGARWDYVVVQSTGEQRAGTVIGTWSADGSDVEYNDQSTSDLNGSTAGIEFEVAYSSGSIQLRSVITSGTWNIVATRYFIPNNGNGSGPISNSLSDGLIYIGNASNLAQARNVSGVITITNTGVTSFTPGIIQNADINNTAAIALSKLATLTANRLLISNGTGQITISTVTTTEASYLAGTGSNIQAQLNSKLTDPTNTVGDLIYRNGSNVISRLGLGTEGQVLTSSGGLPVWSNPSGTIFTKVLELGEWDMELVEILFISAATLNANGIAPMKIRSVEVSIVDDTSAVISQLDGLDADYIPQGRVVSWSTTFGIILQRRTGGGFVSPNYNDPGFNRGWATITYTL